MPKWIKKNDFGGEGRPGDARSGLVWYGLVWSGLVRSGLVWSSQGDGRATQRQGEEV